MITKARRRGLTLAIQRENYESSWVAHHDGDGTLVFEHGGASQKLGIGYLRPAVINIALS